MKKIVLALLVLACFMEEAYGEQARSGDEAYWRTIKPGDLVTVHVRGHDDLSFDFRVPAEGRLVYPVIGELVVAGRRIPTLVNEIAKRLEEFGHLKAPVVTVFVKEHAPGRVYIYGKVRSPRAMDIPQAGSLTAIQAIATAGGFDEDADRSRVKVIRRNVGSGQTETIRIDVQAISEADRHSLDIELSPGDIVYVPASEKIYVLGQVNSPGAYATTPGVGMTVVRAVSLAGGFTRYARYTRVQRIRKTPEGNADIKVIDLGAVLDKGMIQKDETLLPGDIIYVPERIF